MKIRAFVVLCLSLGLLAGCQGPQRVAGPYEAYGPETEVAATQGYQTAAPYGAVGAGYGASAPAMRRAARQGYGPMVVNANNPAVAGPGPGVIAGQQYGAAPGAVQTSQVSFIGPAGARIQWDISAVGAFDSPELVCPGRENFPQNGIYRLKLSHIPGREGVELYPTLEIAPVTPRTVEFLTHQAISVSFTDEDITQVLSGNFVTKVIYLPDPEFQELAIAVGTPDTLVSTRLDPGVDPITEAARRGSIMAIVRLGNIDIQKGGIEAQGIGQPVSMGSPYMNAAGAANQNYYVSGVSGPAYGAPSQMTPSGIPTPAYVPNAYTGNRTEKNYRRNTVDATRPLP
ncbi:MAG: hypothetical protein IKX40_09680 [Thermoguttaceae bacterium]|nr:hypothetical protein [Thermoguttaceae bacterium]